MTIHGSIYTQSCKVRLQGYSGRQDHVRLRFVVVQFTTRNSYSGFVVSQCPGQHWPLKSSSKQTQQGVMCLLLFTCYFPRDLFSLVSLRSRWKPLTRVTDCTSPTAHSSSDESKCKRRKRKAFMEHVGNAVGCIGAGLSRHCQIKRVRHLAVSKSG